VKESRYNIWVEREGTSYLYNGVSGALLRVPAEDRKGLERVLADATATDCSPKVLERMAVGRMLVPDDADELKMLGTRYEMSRNDPTQFAVTVVTSLGCNFDCPYCFEDKHPSIMRDDVQQALLAVLDDQLPTIKTFYATWFGGEPLIGKRPLLALSDAFIERCDAAGVSYGASITTNGYLLDERTCAELRDRRVHGVQVSLDGPPEIHDRMRPLANGKGTFWHIVKNLKHAVDYLPIAVRINLDTGNRPHTEELLQILQAEGLAGKLTVYVGQIVGVNDAVGAPSASYETRCFTSPEYARAEREFVDLATSYGFSWPTLPVPSGAPCTAVRANELVVGSEGELYKCWDSVGNNREVVGTIFDYKNLNGRLNKWLKYDPLADAECRSCIALPVCMGGCAHHAMDLIQYENRCGTFRHEYRAQIETFVEMSEKGDVPDYVAPKELARRMETR
jgi:uncharacterized protein